MRPAQPTFLHKGLILSLIVTFLLSGAAVYLAFSVPSTAVRHKVLREKRKNVAYKKKFFIPCGNKSVFDCTAECLHYLRYLPIVRTGRLKYKFSFPVPGRLQKAADSYAWNSGNPFVQASVIGYLKASQKGYKPGFGIPGINKKLLIRLEHSASEKKFNPKPWKWILVKQAKKGEIAELYENGRMVFSSPVNTGEFSTTPDGTWYVYLRFHTTSMKGISPSRISEKAYESLAKKNPKKVGCLSGHPVKWVKYDDSGIKYVSYFNKGIALHYIQRPKYGFPQSAGCVELPLKGARFLYDNIGYGTVVTVSGNTGKRVLKKPVAVPNASVGETCTEPVTAKPKPVSLSKNTPVPKDKTHD